RARPRRTRSPPWSSRSSRCSTRQSICRSKRSLPTSRRPRSRTPRSERAVGRKHMSATALVVVPDARQRRRARGPIIPGGFRWILPALIISVGLIYYSIIYSGYISFFSWRGGRTRMIPAGLDNYIDTLSDPIFWTAIVNTAVYFVVVFGVQVLGGVFFAAALHSRVYLANIYKILIVIPV